MNFCYFLMIALFLQAVFLVGQGQSARLLADNNGTSLIADTCQHTHYVDVCVQSLRARPESLGADLPGLLAVSIDAAAHATETVSLMKTQLAVADTKSAAGEEREVLEDCIQMYGEGLDSLGQAVDALRRRSYDTVNFMVSGAMASSDACETGFAESEVAESDQLTERNRRFFEMSSNSLAIAKLLG